ncbi:MAG: ABC transporter substrate-binding protein [Betaproteobacteria bacterium]|nr:MAG: ABC transporter substrate-binding protein [Betaproteobacteria bacterium]
MSFAINSTRRTLVLLLAGLATAAVFAQAPDWKKIRIGVEGNYPPFSQIAPDGKLAGFDIDIANAICAQLKADCQLVQQEWDGMIPALNVRKFDAIVASMTISEERKKAVDFSDPYYDVPSRWVAKAGAFKDATPESLRGKKIAVIRNSPRAKFVGEQYKGSETLLVNKETDVYMELAAGRADIGFGSSVVSGEAFLKKPEGKGYAQVGPAVNLGGGAGVGIAIRKGDDALREKINGALKAILADGRYKTMANKYFDFDVSPNRNQ